MIKNTRLMRVIIFVSSILMAVIMYLLAYNIDQNKIEEQLSKELDSQVFSITKIQEIGKSKVKDKDIIVHYNIDNASGIALLHKGFNGKYIINDNHQTYEDLGIVNFIIAGQSYSIKYGQSNEIIADYNPKDKSLEEIQGSSWKGILVTLRSMLIIIFGYMLTSYMGRNHKKDTLGEYNDLPMDGQSIKQTWFR